MRSSFLRLGVALLLTSASCADPETTRDSTDLGDVDDVDELGDDELAVAACASTPEARIPFGAAPAYAAGTILPNNRTRSQLTAATRAFYNQWKSRYLKRGCGANRAYVATGMDDSLTVSEAHGYGMMTLVFMAGHDSAARSLFDAMYRYFRAHPTSGSRDLMAWSQDSSCADNQGTDSATDGDLDIAYALLLAHRQWGSGGAINYRNEATRVINAILDRDVSNNSKWTLLGDWAQSGSYYDATRTSDFMPGHFASFASATGDGRWTTLVNSTYSIVSSLQAQHAPSTGLLPDFVQSPANPRPASAGFLEGANDGAYSWNACRDPWRLAVHFLTSGDTRAKTATQKLNTFIKQKTGSRPEQIKAGYKLNGNVLADANFLTMAYVAPFGVSAMVDSGNQSWLNKVWELVESSQVEGYYEDSIKLLTMIAMSGNWWTPEAGPSLCEP